LPRPSATQADQQISISKYANQLFQSIDPIRVSTRAEAIDKVKSGQAEAALIVPADIVSQLNTLITQGTGNPTVELILNSKDPLERQFAQQAITSRASQVEQAVSKQVLRVAVADLGRVLDGGNLQFFGDNVPLLGLRNARTIVEGTIASLPKDSPLLPALRQVVSFANLAIDGLAFDLADAELDRHSADRPDDRARRQNHADLLVRRRDRGDRVADVRRRAARRRTARARALRAHLLASGARAGDAQRDAVGEDHRVRHRRRGGHAGDGRARVAVRAPGLGAVPAVAGGARAGRPRLAALQAVGNAFSGTTPGIGWPLVHLAVLTLAFGALARLALKRFA
jgi:hypothetical protein